MPVLIPLLALAVFAQGTSEFMLAGLLPEISTDLGVPLSTAGLLTSTFAVGMVIGAPLTAAFSRTWPPRASLGGLLVVFTLMHVAGALTDSIGVLLATRVIAALANAGFLALTLSLVTRVVPPERQARALALILAGTTLALIAGVPAGAAIGAALDWRAALWAIALICLPALIAVLAAAPRRALGSTPSLRRELQSLRDPRLIRTLALVAIVNAATFCGYTYLAPVVTGPAGLTPGAVPLTLALFGTGAFAGVTLAGRYADRYSVQLLAIGLPVLGTLWLATLLVSSSGWVLGIAVTLVGAASFAVGSTVITLAMRQAVGAPTIGGSYPTAALNVGAMLGPVLGGLAIETPAGPRGPLLISTTIAALALVTYLLSRATITSRVTP